MIDVETHWTLEDQQKAEQRLKKWLNTPASAEQQQHDEERNTEPDNEQQKHEEKNGEPDNDVVNGWELPEIKPGMEQ